MCTQATDKKEESEEMEEFTSRGAWLWSEGVHARSMAAAEVWHACHQDGMQQARTSKNTKESKSERERERERERDRVRENGVKMGCG